MKLSQAQLLFEEAQKLMPGGVNSPVRAFKAVGGTPPLITRARGSQLDDVDGNKYIDYVCSWGALIVGHAHPQVTAIVKEAVERGTSYGAPTELEIELAQLITQALPSIELVRFVNSGTEATMSALRVARAYTKREKVLKFAGCYHGHADTFLVQAGSGVATLGLPGSAGVARASVQDTLVAPYNDLSAVEDLFNQAPEEIAAVIVEPIAGNMGVVPPKPSFLQGLRRLTMEHGALLIFDEVITGFRVAYGGAQTLYGVKPDLTCLGKIIGGGLPVGAYGGRRQIMELVAPLGPVYQAGTLSGNPLAMTAGIETLKLLQQPAVYTKLEELSDQLARELAAMAARAGVPVQLNRAGSMLTPFFSDFEILDYASAQQADTHRYARFFWGMLERGIYLPPSQFEALFVSLAHTSEDVRSTLIAAEDVLPDLRRS
jgi:glutamate-1-semialdehyde 2,1-aminomutase